MVIAHIHIWALKGQKPQTLLDRELETVVSPLITCARNQTLTFARTVPALNS